MNEWYLNQYFVYLVIPVISVITVSFFKYGTRKDEDEFDIRDYADFYFDLSMTALTLLMTNLPVKFYEVFNSQNVDELKRLAPYPLYLFVFFICMYVISVVVRKHGWDENNKLRPIIGILIPDIISLVLLFWAMVLVYIT